MHQPPSQRPGPDTAPTRGPYRIHVVAELTGVPAATLRAWERRYGIPSPQRTTSGYRLYGERDVDIVRRMQRLCESGVSAAEAAREVLRRAEPGGQAPPSTDLFELGAGRIVEAVVRFDPEGLEDELRRALFLGTTTQVVERTFKSALRTLGDLWHDGSLSIAQEHLASERIAAIVRELLQLTKQDSAGEIVLLACFADEQHVIGVLSTAVRLAAWGFQPVVLGARTPPEAIRDAVKGMSPSFVALSVTVPPPPERAVVLLDDYRAACGDIPWIVGGVGAPEVAELVAARGGIVAPDDPAKLRSLTHSLVRSGKRSNPRRARSSAPEPDEEPS